MTQRSQCVLCCFVQASFMRFCTHITRILYSRFAMMLWCGVVYSCFFIFYILFGSYLPRSTNTIIAHIAWIASHDFYICILQPSVCVLYRNLEPPLLQGDIGDVVTMGYFKPVQGATFLFPCPLTSVPLFLKNIVHDINTFHFFFICPLEGR
jgi:hypothetical protein